MHVTVTCKYEKDLMKNSREKWQHRFHHFKSTGAICCHRIQISDINLGQNLIQPFPMMLQIKFVCIGLLVAGIFMFENVNRRTDARWLDFHPISSPCEPSAQVS